MELNSPVVISLINELRSKFQPEEIPSGYDHDYNFLRWIMASEKNLQTNVTGAHDKDHKNKRKSVDEVLNAAHLALIHHLKFRKALKLDEIDIPTWDENPMFVENLVPRGQIKSVDKHNRLVWFVDYGTLDMKGVMHSISSTDMLRYHFYQYEIMLKMVVEREKMTGKMSGINHIGDLEGYDMNPYSMLFASSGSLAYYTSLFHFQHYPELINPLCFIKAPRWVYLAYRMVKSMSPYLVDRIKLFDCLSYQAELLKDIQTDQLPTFYGGNCPYSGELVTIPAKVVPECRYYQFDSENDPTELLHLRVNAGRRKLVHVDVAETPVKLQWFFKTDGELEFGIFRKQNHQDSDSSKLEVEHLEMVTPWFRLGAKLVPERGDLVCDKTGSYFMIFCNRNSWFSRRNVFLHFSTGRSAKRVKERTLSM